MEWDPSPILISFESIPVLNQIPLIKHIALRWYSLLFVGGFLTAYANFRWLTKLENRSDPRYESLLMHVFVGAIIGARIGHCLFYDPAYYLSHPWEILYVWKGGLASHGGTLGVVLSVIWFQKKNPDFDFFWAADLICISTPIAACSIRLGNFMNQEILGKPTDFWTAITFLSGDPYVEQGLQAVPRHPSQLYEAITYIFIFLIMLAYYFKFRPIAKGSAFGLMLALIFGSRFFLEFSKTRQAAFDTGIALNVGQLLSIPFLLAGVGLMIWSIKRQKQTRS